MSDETQALTVLYRRVTKADIADILADPRSSAMDRSNVFEERDQLRAELAAIRGQQSATVLELRKASSWICREVEAGTTSATHWATRLRERADQIEAGTPQQPDAVSVVMSDAELDALWREIQDTAMREPGLPHIRFARAILAAKFDDAVSVPRELEALQAECDNLRISLKDADHGMVLFMQQRDELHQELETLRGLAVRIVKAGPSIGSSSGQLVDGWAAMEELRTLLSTRQAEEGE